MTSATRHFLRTDAGVAVGPAPEAVVFVNHGDTLHLNEAQEQEAKVIHLCENASSGWVEVDEAGAAVPRRATASPLVIPPVDPPDLVPEIDPDVIYHEEPFTQADRA